MNLRDHLSANLSILFTEVPFLDRFEFAARHGFKAVEFWFPYEFPAAQVRARLDANGLTLVGMNSASGDASKGEWGLAVDPAKREKFQASVQQAIEYALALGSPNIHVMAGVVPADITAQQADALYRENIAWACDQANKAGKNVLIEPLNPVDRPGYLLSCQAHARTIVQTLDRPNLKVMFDIYHVQMTEGRILDNLHASLPYIGHIQLADVPGRHEPDTGEIRFAQVIAEIERTGYFARGGWLGCEYKPKTTSAHSLGWRDTVLT